MVTIKDIAKKCGVSASTVSKAMNGYYEIGGKTTANILQTAKEMGYYPNAMARSLKTNRSYTIGILFTDNMMRGLTHQYFSGVLNSFKMEVERLGYDITFINHNIGTTQMTFLEHCKYRCCDGVMVACENYDDEDVRELFSSDIPLVTIDYVVNNRTAILSDNIEGIKEILEYVYKKGHRKIAYVHGEKSSSVTQKRLASFYRTCESLNMDIPLEYVKEAKYLNVKTCSDATSELLKLADPPTCILYPDDLSLLGGKSQIERLGLHVPDDISVVGFDGTYISQVMYPKLTTVAQDTEVIGKKAAYNLVDAIERSKYFIPSQIVVPTKFIEGETVKDINA